MNERQLERIENQLDGMSADLTEIKVTLARNTDSLELHVRRTDLLETRVETFGTALDQARGAQKVFLALAALVSFAVAALELWTALRGH